MRYLTIEEAQKVVGVRLGYYEQQTAIKEVKKLQKAKGINSQCVIASDGIFSRPDTGFAEEIIIKVLKDMKKEYLNKITIETKVNVLKSVLDELSTIGIASNPKQKMESLNMIKDLFSEYPTKKANRSDKNEKLADYYTTGAKAKVNILLLGVDELNKELFQIAAYTEKALSYFL